MTKEVQKSEFLQEVKEKYGDVLPERSVVVASEPEGFMRRVKVLFRNWTLFVKAYNEFTLPKPEVKEEKVVKPKATPSVKEEEVDGED